jgi:hypothetical protein
MNSTRGRGQLVICALMAVATAQPAAAKITITGPDTHVHSKQAIDADDLVTLDPDPVSYVGGASADMQAILKAALPTWTFTFGGTLDGTLHIETYSATSSKDDWGGALMDATYTRVATDPTIADLHWIQIVTTNAPLKAGEPTTGYVDPIRNPYTRPWYYSAALDQSKENGNKTATTYHFHDHPKREARSDPDDITWRGELLMASSDGVDSAKVYDGFDWGFDLQDDPDLDRGVPEPSTWSMMVLGLGALGAALRFGRSAGRASAETRG